MERYHLDDLGWYQFESLIQSLLKAKCGLSVESWGKQGDFGRDAYSPDPLSFPSNTKNNGPFIFQVKFVENASAAGAKPDQPLISAVRKEIKAIQKRKKSNEWEEPKYFTLVSNAPLSSALRKKAKDIIAKELTNTKIIVWGSTDVSDLLDDNQSIRRSFPQLLTIRELDYLLENVVNKDIRERSRGAIDEAKSVIQVFVPTSTYKNCWDILKKNHFVVLDGPPEVGKTAIAWMISVTQVTFGWQAIVCEKPKDFFRIFQNDVQQIFIADDAFGRTEFDITLGRLWEKDLSKIISRLDSKHWLICTSRRHILENALHEMDLQGIAVSFPNPAELIVDASDLTIKEKALILYRHAKAAHMEDEAKMIIKNNAKMIVRNTYFTPERIRRFVQETLPELIGLLREGKLTDQTIRREINNTIKRPTDRMQKSFNKLSLAHKLVLLSLLKESGVSIEKAEENFNGSFSEYLQGEKYKDLLYDLSETFIHLS